MSASEQTKKGQSSSQVETDFNPDFLRHMFPKLDWSVFRDAAMNLAKHLPDNDGDDGSFPEEVIPCAML